jgi:hypothetical protein
MDETAVCVVDDKGKVALKVSVVTDPEVIKVALKPLSPPAAMNQAVPIPCAREEEAHNS